MLWIGSAKPVPLQPMQIATNRLDITKAGSVKLPQKGCRTLCQVSFRQGRHDRLELRSIGGMADIKLGVNRQQLEQIEQPLEIQKTGIAMAFKGL